MAMDLLGFELTDEQRLELEKAEEERQARAEQMVQQHQGKRPDEQSDDNQEENTPVRPQERPGDAKSGSLMYYDQEAEEKAATMKLDMAKWRHRAIQRMKEGQRPDEDFVSEYIDASIKSRILAQLSVAKSINDVKRAFVGNSNNEPDAQSIQALTAALSDVALAMREKDG